MIRLPGLRLLVIVLAIVGSGLSARPADAQISRTVFVTATDDKGAFVPDLRVEDIGVREGGRDRPVVSVVPSTVPMQVAILIEEGLSGDTSVREAVFQFARSMNDRANVAVFVVGRRSTMVVDYTTDLEVIVRGLNGLGMASLTFDENLVEGIYEAAKNVAQIERGRRVIIAMGIERPQASQMDPRQAVDELRKSGAMFYAAMLTMHVPMSGSPSEVLDSSRRDEVLGRGTSQSGGRRQEVPRTTGFPMMLAGIATELRQQYAVGYELPAGVTPTARVDVTLKRKGVKLRAPSQIPDR